MKTRALVVTKGHPFDYNGFHGLFDGNPTVEATFVEHPAAQVMLRPDNVTPYDVMVFYDMQGIPLPGADPALALPSDDYVNSIEALLDSGKGLVLLNHALVQWPLWPLWREISGTSFRLTAGEVDGHRVPGSGYRGGAGEPHRNARHRLTPAGPPHPVTAGLEAGFEIVDELYLRTPLTRSADIMPLLVSDYAFVQANFNPPPLAPERERRDWSHPDGDSLIVWAKRTRRSPVVACEAGDGPEAYANPGFRRLLDNAIAWTASEPARRWARGDADAA